MKDHLLENFGGNDTREVLTTSLFIEYNLEWSLETDKELQKIPEFVRGKIKRNIEKYDCEQVITKITLETMYAVKEAG